MLCLSGVALRVIDTHHPDLIGALLLFCVSLLIFALSGMSRRITNLYFLLTLPALLSLFTSWTLFNPVLGSVILLRFPLYSGHLALGLAVWEGVWLAIVCGYFLWTRKITLGIVLATLVAIVLTHTVTLPSWTFAQISFFHPLTVIISDRGLLVAITKVIGYAAMVLITIALMVSSRDVELIGLLRQFRTPQPVVFFLGTVFRSLDLALSDYETVRQAQLARAIDARPRTIVKRLADLSSLAVPMVAMMIRRSSEIGDALMARGYTLTQASADFYETSPWRLIDWAVIVVCLGLLYLALGPRINLTTLLHL